MKKQLKMFVCMLLLVCMLLGGCDIAATNNGEQTQGNTDATTGSSVDASTTAATTEAEHVCVFEQIEDEAYLVSAGDCQNGATYKSVCSCGKTGEEYTMSNKAPHADNDGNFVCDTCKEKMGSLTCSATLFMLKDGCNAVATLNFDDGHYETAALLQELFEEYNLNGTLFMITSKTTDIAKWKRLFAKGRLEPQSHSSMHYVISPPTYSKYNPANNTPENIKYETADSKTQFEKWFPDTDCLVYAVPNSQTIPDYEKAIMSTFYAARIAAEASTTKIQSVDPAMGMGAGSWYNPYIQRNRFISGRETLKETLAYLDACVNKGGWFINLCHAIVDENRGSAPYDMTEADARALFAAMKKYVDQGKLWSATYSDAVKYIRERQNSTVEQYINENGIFVKLTMSEKTEDGLPLPADIFNMPLTVKIAVPDGWTKVKCTQGDVTEIVDTYVQKNKTYANINIVPNGGDAAITNGAQ